MTNDTTPSATHQHRDRIAANEARGDWAIDGLAAYLTAKSNDGESLPTDEPDSEEQIINLMTDLQHLALRLGYDIERIRRLSTMHFDTERL
ncbi:MAG: hypothetical protein R3C19_12105 [Planctomycetaceae bacterium]